MLLVLLVRMYNMSFFAWISSAFVAKWRYLSHFCCCCSFEPHCLQMLQLHPLSVAAWCILCVIRLLLGAFTLLCVKKRRYFQLDSLLQLSPSRRNSCPNTLSERGCVRKNRNAANQRRGPAHTLALVYYWNSALIGGKVGKVGLCAAFRCAVENGRVVLSRRNAWGWGFQGVNN